MYYTISYLEISKLIIKLCICITSLMCHYFFSRWSPTTGFDLFFSTICRLELDSKSLLPHIREIMSGCQFQNCIQQFTFTDLRLPCFTIYTCGECTNYAINTFHGDEYHFILLKNCGVVLYCSRSNSRWIFQFMHKNDTCHSFGSTSSSSHQFSFFQEKGGEKSS